MGHALVTIAAPLAVARIEEALGLIGAMGNPAAPGLSAALDRLDGDDGIHFASLHAIPPTDPQGARGHLVLEFSADGAEDAAVARIADRIGAELAAVFALAEDRGGGELAGYLRSHRVRIGHGWFGQAGLAFAGTPGMSVGRIRREAILAERLTAWIGAQDGGLSALDRLDDLRAKVRADEALKWALDTPAALPPTPQSTTLGLIVPVGLSFIRTYLWPLALPFAVVLGFGLWHVVWWLMGIVPADIGLGLKLWLTLKASWSALLWLLGAICAFAIPVLICLGLIYVSLRRKEATDWIADAGPRREVLRRILANENQLAQNHMVSITALKPGLTRDITVRLAFWLISSLAVLSFKPGRLGDIGTIHFARWVTLPGSRDFVFFSNYGGSWESYLEDFITKAHNGLTAVWSNTVGFPKSENLFGKGATDGERFKRYARRSMLPTPFWYSAYHSLTTDNIRTNAAIRVGLGAVLTDEEAATFLALFGSAPRPAAKLESNQIQSLVFGGLGFMPHGELILVDLNDHAPSARGWLKEVLPQIAFDDGRRLERTAVVTLGLGPKALAKAGLPDDAVESFPPAFLDGMTGPGRSRILGDDPADPDHPWWWRTKGTYDAALLVYGVEEADAVALSIRLKALTEGYGHTVGRAMPLCEIPGNPADRLEPFGFLDGVSQPAIRGTYRGLRNADPIHLVEPGEFILGYPDNRGNVPPGPVLKALDDPDNRLPIRCDNTSGFNEAVAEAPREIGRNGSFLVIRQLEQDRAAFRRYCDEEAARLRDRLPEPYHITWDFIGAKLVGRWPDGSSLTRNPYRSFTDPDQLPPSPTQRPASNPGDAAAIAPAPAPTPSAALPAEAAATAVVKAKAGDAAPARRGGRVADNDFLFGAEDPEGLRCPFGAHIRRANPRDSLDPGSQDQVDISNRHRIIRVGRTYAPQEGEKEGLMFMCLAGDIERQFEFVQQTWMGSETFHGLSGERDALAGNKAGCPIGFTVPTRDGPIRLKPMSRFVTPRGGGYFFLPGRKLLEFLSG